MKSGGQNVEVTVKVHCCLPFELLRGRSLQREGGACGLLAAQRWHAVRGAIMQSASAAMSHLDIVDSTVPDLPGAHSATGQHRGGEDGWNSPAAARQTSELGDPDDEVLEFLTPARKEAILTGISEMLEIMKERSLDSMKTDMIRRMLCSGTVDLTVMECFLGDGQWNPEMSRFDGAPDWDEVQRALEALRESVLEEHLTVRPNTQPMLCNPPALPGAGGSGVRHPAKFIRTNPYVWCRFTVAGRRRRDDYVRLVAASSVLQLPLPRRWGWIWTSA